MSQHFHVQCNNLTQIVRLHTYQVYEAYGRSSKSSSPYISLERLCSPSSTCAAPGMSSKPHLDRRILYDLYEPHFSCVIYDDIV